MNLDVAEDFSGVISISSGAQITSEHAYGPADRAHGIAMAVDTQLAMASGSKAFTAATALALIDDGALNLDTTARSLLGSDLPLIADDVTVEQLLTHRSGIGDYVDEDLGDDILPTVPVSTLENTEAYVPALDGFATKFAAGSRFSYCNSGYVVLALLAERASGVHFADLARRYVFGPAAMTDTAYLRSDRLPGRAAIGYLDDGRTNVFALPVVGSGDGGAYTTVADVRRFWSWLPQLPGAAAMSRPSTVDTGNPLAYGMGMWMSADASTLVLEGADQGVSFRSVHVPRTSWTATVVSNTSGGAWPVARAFVRIATSAA
jgi:CubicO group peptidase (beta-lactamase class C family)